MMRTMTDDFLAKLGRILQTLPGQLDAAGEAVLHCTVEGTPINIRILLSEEHQVLSLATAVAHAPDGDDALAFGKALLAANLLGAGALGLSFSLSPRDQLVYLGHCLIAPGITYEAFETAFSRLALLGSRWKKQFASAAPTRLDD